MRTICFVFASLVAWSQIVACTPARDAAENAVVLTEVGRSERQWTGIAISPDERIFVNYPRWSDDVPVSVGELSDDGTVMPYPNEEINRWREGADPGEHFVCVQSVVIDREGFLWILDPANPKFQGVIPGGAKLLKIDLGSKQIIQRVLFPESIAFPKSYLNDVRIDTQRQIAYITDSGVGAIVVVDLNTGESRRLLDEHFSTSSENITLNIGGKPWIRPDGIVPQVHADGLALDPEGQYLYYQALSGRNLYRIDTEWLRNAQYSAELVAGKVEHLQQSGASDGLLYGQDHRVYISALEENAVKAYRISDGQVEIVVKDEMLAWPDSFAAGPDGAIYVTTSQIHLWRQIKEPYKIFKIGPAH
ncbi:MAG: hypothetical protein JRE16_04955 [Deltaproteobacteria bacterium]|jgi:sugar lactone lactonase YvrE|nr:hypothetical protein [Deltaproteobacteria bacterium]